MNDIFLDEDTKIINEAREDLEEDILGQTIYFKEVIDEAVYSEHDFSKRNFNIVYDLKVRFYEISETARDLRDEPYNTWEADDFVTLEMSLQDKIHEITIFIDICEEMKKAFEISSDKADLQKILDICLKLLERKVSEEKYSEEVLNKMKKGLQNLFKELSE
ncbi:MAG: hypothetical protein RBS56_01360 [Candidatus Gracilibacteria bacterium]|jgi:hypothetical protein|nr:hypothetical protein [Candidatus Gracilibacteria bacterium]